MVITQTREPGAASRPVELVKGFVGAVLFGAAMAAGVVGPVVGRMDVFWAGVGLLLFAFVVVSLGSSRRKRAQDAAAATSRRALALIESRRAIGGETADVPVEFVLTVAPDDASAYRVETNHSVNLVDLPNYTPRGVVVVEYQPERPWNVTVVDDPGPEWAGRAAAETVDSAPESTMVVGPNEGYSYCLLFLVGLLIGAAAVIVPFRAQVFDDGGSDTTKSSSSTTTSSSSFSTSDLTTEFSSTRTASGSVTVDSMLADGEMRWSAESLIKGMGTDKVFNLSIGERVMEVKPVVVPATDAGAAPIDMRAIPYERLPALVAEARSALGIKNPTSWHIGFEPDARTKVLSIRVTVSDDRGAASLEADAQGHVTKRNPG
ncbi:hypothetical protein [Streptomyces sp. SID3343]|uniref:hypothetical protein n=1 Tax=Streptomyces sp. SID3343 TaxID=2690260 RepID=UPI001371A732|nr:hypothetical protein [Streptomyces sp. SID3343]MYW03897.1 hypothetical protein [Streptomyces sp. SID3343]